MCDCHLPGHGDDLATLARRLIDACGPFPGDSWLHDVAATGLPPQPRSLEPLIPDAWGLRLLDSVREHARHAEQVAARLRLDYLFRPRGRDDTIRIVRPDRDGGREPYRDPAGLFRTGTQDTVAGWDARFAACFVTDAAPPQPSAPPDEFDPVQLLDKARDLIERAPPAVVTDRPTRHPADLSITEHRHLTFQVPEELLRIPIPPIHTSPDKNGPNPDLPEQPPTADQQPETITDPEPRYTSPHTTSPPPAQTPATPADRPGHKGHGRRPRAGGSR